MKHGVGVFTWADGSKYEGNFKDDQFNGDGEYKRADGKHYKGKYKAVFLNPLCININDVKPLIQVRGNKGLMHGQGEYTWPDGKVYTGNISIYDIGFQNTSIIFE